jgi:DNA-binding IclR family transcriptional regulator
MRNPLTRQLWADLPPRAVKVYDTIFIFGNRSIRSLSKLSGLDPLTVIRALEDLRRLGLLPDEQSH